MAGTKEGARKARETIRKKREIEEECGRINKIMTKKKAHRPFNRPEKNRVRDMIIPLTKEKVPFGNILTLETNNFSYAKRLGDEYNIFVVEKEIGEIIRMIEKGPPANTHVIYGDVTKIPLDMVFEIVYLDWCGKYSREKIESCMYAIKNAQLVGFTFSLMREKKGVINKIIKEIVSILGNDWNPVPVLKERYSDSSPMVTLFFERKVIEMSRQKLTPTQKAALKAWKTRRENAEKRRLALLSEQEKRSERAKKAWETRRKNQRLGI